MSSDSFARPRLVPAPPRIAVLMRKNLHLLQSLLGANAPLRAQITPELSYEASPSEGLSKSGSFITPDRKVGVRVLYEPDTLEVQIDGQPWSARPRGMDEVIEKWLVQTKRELEARAVRVQAFRHLVERCCHGTSGERVKIDIARGNAVGGTTLRVDPKVLAVASPALRYSMREVDGDLQLDISSPSQRTLRGTAVDAYLADLYGKLKNSHHRQEQFATGELVTRPPVIALRGTLVAPARRVHFAPTTGAHGAQHWMAVTPGG